MYSSIEQISDILWMRVKFLGVRERIINKRKKDRMNAKVSELDEYEFTVLLYKQIKNYTHTHTHTF